MSQYYVGVKIVEARPCIRDGIEGYAVKYSDGYVSWSPKEVFEASYLPMGDGNDNMVTQAMITEFVGNGLESSDLPDGKTTLVQCKTISGFMQYETASCVDPENYDARMGMAIGVRKIEETLWKCLGFVVQWGKFGLKGNK
jgi:hypothetical protein